jgi:hypothetical protein
VTRKDGRALRLRCAPRPHTPVTRLSAAHSGSARPTPTVDANGPVGIPPRLFHGASSNAGRAQLASSSAPSSVGTLHFCWSIDSRNLARSARNAQRNRGPEDANRRCQQLVQDTFVPSTRRRPSAGVSSASLIANARDIVSHRAHAMSRGVETEHQSPIDAKHSRVRSARAS